MNAPASESEQIIRELYRLFIHPDGCQIVDGQCVYCTALYRASKWLEERNLIHEEETFMIHKQELIQ